MCVYIYIYIHQNIYIYIYTPEKIDFKANNITRVEKGHKMDKFLEEIHKLLKFIQEKI